MQTPVYWFPAKQAGYGWGLPEAWQGWVVVVVFFVLLGGGRYALRGRPRHVFSAYAVALVFALLGVMYFKGEPLN